METYGRPAVGDDRRDERVGVVELARDLDRGDERGAGRAAGEQALAGDQAAGHQERVLVRDPDVAVDDLGVEGLGPEVLADPLDAVRMDRPPGVDRALGVGSDHLERRALLLEVAADAGHRAAGAEGDHEVGQPPAGLAPELGPGRAVVGLGVGLVEVLVWLEGAVDLLGQPIGDPVVGLRRVGIDRGRADDDLGAEGAQGVDLLPAHLVGHHRHHAVAAKGGRHRQPEPGVAGGRLDQRPARPEQPRLLRGVDHRHRGPVLDRPAGVHELDLRDERRAHLGGEAREAHDGRLADQVENGVPDLAARLRAHRLSLVTEVPTRCPAAVVHQRGPPVRRGLDIGSNTLLCHT